MTHVILGAAQHWAPVVVDSVATASGAVRAPVHLIMRIIFRVGLSSSRFLSKALGKVDEVILSGISPCAREN